MNSTDADFSGLYVNILYKRYFLSVSICSSKDNLSMGTKERWYVMCANIKFRTANLRPFLPYERIEFLDRKIGS